MMLANGNGEISYSANHSNWNNISDFFSWMMISKPWLCFLSPLRTRSILYFNQGTNDVVALDNTVFCGAPIKAKVWYRVFATDQIHRKKRWISHWSNSRAKNKSIGRFLILFQIQNDSSRNEWDRFHGVEFSEVGKTCHHRYTRLMSKQHMQIWSDMDEDIYKSVESV